jgi:hypothetical protein
MEARKLMEGRIGRRKETGGFSLTENAEGEGYRAETFVDE